MKSYLVKRIRNSVVAAIWLLSSLAASENQLVYPQYTVDDLVIVEGAADLLRDAEPENISANPSGSAIEIQGKAQSGSVYLQPIRTKFPFNEAIPSWNGWAGPDSGFRIWMRAGASDWSTPWIEAGTWGRLADEPTTRIATFPGGRYDLDTLLLQRPAEWVQFRIDLVRSAEARRSPSIRLLALAYTNSTGDRKLWDSHGNKKPKLSKAIQELRTTESLAVPFCSQVIPRKEWIGRICAASSINMALGHFGVKTSTQSVAEAIYDKVADLFGVWHRSIQGVAQHGVRGYIRRFRNWDDVRDAVQKGYVICSSIRFNLEDLADPPKYRKRGTQGHLITITGFAPGGYVIVNDSATKAHGRNQPWRQDDLALAWFDKGGVAYVFTGPAKQ